MVGKPAARLTDAHVCPMVTGTVPHVGGPIASPGVPTVLIGGVPAAVVGDMCVCAGPPDAIAVGSAGVMIGGKPAARMGDSTAHGGKIVAGCATVLIGEKSPGAPSPGMVGAAVAGAIHPSFPYTAAVAGAVAGADAPAPAALSGAAAGAAATKAPKQSEERAWFRAIVKYEDDTTAAGVKYKVTPPDGSKPREGVTSAKGVIFEGSMPPGQCKVTLPELDKDTWRPK